MTRTKQQLEWAAAAQFFCLRSGATGIIVATNNPTELIGQFASDIPVYVVCPWSSRLRYRKTLRAPDLGLQFISKRSLTEQFVADKLFVYLKRGGHLQKPLSPRVLHLAARAALVSMVLDRTDSSIKYQAPLSGLARHYANAAAKDLYINLGGRLLQINQHKTALVSVLAIVAVYNERDIIAATIKHLLDQGVDVHIIDNWSTDGSYEIVQSLASKSSGISYERFPTKANNKYEWGKILARVTTVAKQKPQYQWIMLNDADELRWSPWQGVTLQTAFSFIDSVGYNAVDYTVFNFEPTKDGFSEHDNPLTFFRYGKFSGVEGHFVQIKSWKNHPEAELAASGGHHVAFSGQRVFPLKFLLSHYPIRSTRQATDKVFKGRQARYTTAEKKKGWHTHYNSISAASSFIQSPRGLVAFDYANDSFYETYLLERLSGVGIKRDPPKS